jgi:major membrane immunogen (membrane-anchored lipoprotein)
MAIAVALVAITLVGCGSSDSGDGSESKAAESSSAEPSSPSTSETTSPAPVVVGLATTCELYFGDMKGGDLAFRVVNAVNKPNLGTEDLAKYEDLADSLRGISERSQPALRPYLDAQAVVMEGFAEDIRNGSGSSHDLQDFRASGYELLERCRPIS